MYRRQLLGGTVAVIIVVQWWPTRFISVVSLPPSKFREWDPQDWSGSACKKCLTNGAQPDRDSHGSGVGVPDGTISQIA